MNSQQGNICTDKGPWSPGLARDLGREHTLCTRHETTELPTACQGQEHYDACFSDLSKLVYTYKKIDQLEAKIQECRQKYGHLPNTEKYIDKIDQDKEKICRAYTQNIMTYNHTTTARGEGFNDRIKGHRDLIPMLAEADLLKLHDHLTRLVNETEATIIKVLVKLR